MKKNYKLTYFALLLTVSTTVIPFIWMILTAFKTFEESILIPPTLLPENWSFDNFQIVFNKFPFIDFYINTFFMVGVSVIGQLFVCSLAAYAFARLDFPFK